MARIDPGTVRSAEAHEAAARARGYPFRAPKQSYVYCDGEEWPIVDPSVPLGTETLVMVGNKAVTLAKAVVDRGGRSEQVEIARTPIIAYGSNGSVETLRRKFEGSSDTAVIPALRATLLDFDVVYSAHFFAGTIPATLQRSGGASFQPFVLYLTSSQLERMHETESVGENYDYIRLDQISLTLDSGERLNSLTTYISRPGALCIRDTEIALADVAADNRRFRALNQLDVQEEVRRVLAADVPLDRFMRENASDEDKAQARSERLRETACAFRWNTTRA
jgi:hypothetical protein